MFFKIKFALITKLGRRCGKAGFQTLVKRKMIVSNWPAILIGKAEFCTCHKANERPRKGKPEKYQRKCKTEKLPVTFQVNQKKNLSNLSNER